MSLGLSSGINIIENLELAKEVVGNQVLANAIVSIKESVINGGSLSVGFSVTKVFPSFLVRMVEVGERSGNLVEGFSKAHDYYNKEIPRVIKRIFTLLEPLLIVVMGIVVGGITLSVFLPLVKMSQALGG
jgi:type IV pilus assembly protein PilC